MKSNKIHTVIFTSFLSVFTYTQTHILTHTRIYKHVFIKCNRLQNGYLFNYMEPCSSNRPLKLKRKVRNGLVFVHSCLLVNVILRIYVIANELLRYSMISETTTKRTSKGARVLNDKALVETGHKIS